MTTSACSPSPTSRRKMPGLPFQRTTSPARQIWLILAGSVAARRVVRWLALRGSPPGNRARPDISLLTAPLLLGALGSCGFWRASLDRVATEDQVEEQNEEQNAAETKSAAVPVSPITEPAAKQEHQNKHDQDEVQSVDLSSAFFDG